MLDVEIVDKVFILRLGRERLCLIVVMEIQKLWCKDSLGLCIIVLDICPLFFPSLSSTYLSADKTKARGSQHIG